MEKRYDVSEVVEIPQKKRKNAGKKALIIIIAVIIAIIFAAVVGVLLYMNSIGINYIDTDDNTVGDNTNDDVLYENLREDEAEEYHNMITAIRDNSDISSSLYSWYTNKGELMKHQCPQ